MKNSRKFRNLSILILTAFLLFLVLFFIAFGKKNYSSRTGYELPGKVIELTNTAGDFHILKIAHSMPVSHPQHKSINEKISYDIKKDPSNNIIPEIYPENELGLPRNLFQAVQKGTIEMILINADDLWDISLFSIFSIPYLFNTFEELNSFMTQEAVEQKWSREFRRRNVKYLGWSYGSFSHIVSNIHNDPYDEVDNHVAIENSSPYLESFFMESGMTLIDYNSAMTISNRDNKQNPLLELNSEELVKFKSDIHIDSLRFRNYLLVPCFYLVNLDFWNDLTEAEQTLLENSALRAMEYQKDMILSSEAQHQIYFDGEFGPVRTEQGLSKTLLIDWIIKNNGSDIIF